MDRDQIEQRLTYIITTLPDERVFVLNEMVKSWEQPTVFSTLPPEEVQKLDDAIASMDRGEGIPWEEFRKNMKDAIASA
jgi:hypothetical protein